MAILVAFVYCKHFLFAFFSVFLDELKKSIKMEISEKTQNVIKWPESNKNIDLITFFAHGGLLTHKNILPNIYSEFTMNTLFFKPMREQKQTNWINSIISLGHTQFADNFFFLQ